MLIEKDLVHEIILASPSGGFNIFDTLSPFLRPLLKKRHAQNKKRIHLHNYSVYCDYLGTKNKGSTCEVGSEVKTLALKQLCNFILCPVSPI